MQKQLIVIIQWILYILLVYRRVLCQQDELITNYSLRNKNQERLLLSECHYSCQECDGSTQYDCLSCNTDVGRQYDSIKRMCLCQPEHFDVGILECLIFDKAVPTGLYFQENLINVGYCKFGQFQVVLQNNTVICLNCPNLKNENLYCLDCYLNPNIWYEQSICTSDFVRVQKDQNYGYLMQKRDENDFEVYVITETFNLKLSPNYQHICSYQDKNLEGYNCQLMKQIHLEKQLYAVCKDYIVKAA